MPLYTPTYDRLDFNTPANMRRAKEGQWNPSGGTPFVPGVNGYPAPTTVGFTAISRTVVNTNLLTSTPRLGYVTAATAGSVGQYRETSQRFQLSNGTNGGFLLIFRFGISDPATVSDARFFLGVRTASTPVNMEPSAISNCIGIGHGASDTNLKIFFRGSSAQTPIDLGSNYPITPNTGIYEFSIFAPIGEADTVHYRVDRLGTAFTTQGVITGDSGALPLYGTFVGAWGYRTNNASALAVGLDIATVDVRTDF